MLWLSVLVGGAVGSVVRYGIGMWLNNATWPFGTWLVNALGSFLIGFLFVYGKEKMGLSPEAYLLWTTGFMGGFTTFSTFSLEVVQMILDGRIAVAILYSSASVGAGIFCAYIGIAAARQLPL